MKWPWVGRLAYDTAISERDWARDQLSKALDHNRRLERKAEGLTEVAPEKKPADPMPYTLRDLIARFNSISTRNRLAREAHACRADGESWAEIEMKVVAMVNEPDDE